MSRHLLKIRVWSVGAARLTTVLRVNVKLMTIAPERSQNMFYWRISNGTKWQTTI
jgi:hypothetical protein